MSPYITFLSRSGFVFNKLSIQCTANTRYLASNYCKDVKNNASKKKDDTKIGEDGVAEWIRELHDSDHDRPPIVQKYRRQDYKDPYDRTIGILKDDFKIAFHNALYFAKSLYTLMFTNVFTTEYEKSLKMQAEDNSAMMKDSKEIIKEPENPKNSSIAVSQHLNLILQKKKEYPRLPVSKNLLGKLTAPFQPKLFPSHCDVVIIGAGAIGCSIAYHLKKNALDGLNIVMIEKDSTYKEASTVLSVGGIRHQFSLPENILLSMYGMEFMQNIPRLLEIEGVPPPCINFQPHGYLTLASEEGVKNLKDCFYIQRNFNARVKYLESASLKRQFPWMNLEGVGGGIIGTENEGWFDPWSLLMGLRRKAVNLGVNCIEGEAIGFGFSNDMNTFTDGHPSNSEKRINQVKVRMEDGEERTINTAAVILATGPNTGHICYDMLGIGAAPDGIMAYPVPIEPKKRYVYSFHAPKGPGIATPLVIDPSGAYFRREGLGNMYIAGMSPEEHEEPLCNNLEVDHDYFTEKIWPIIAHRVPGFEELKVQGAWAGFYEQNVFDQNGIIGNHPIITNLVLSAGFSGHGIQHSLGVGRAVMELFLKGDFTSIDLTRFSYERLLLNEPVYEVGIV